MEMLLGNWAREITGGLPRSFWVLWTGNLINRSGAFVAILLTFYLSKGRGFSSSYIGLVVGLIGAGGAVGGFLGGHLADHWGRRKSLLLAQALTTAMLLLMGLVTQKWLFPVAGVALGLAQSMARPVFSTMMLDVIPSADRVRAFSLNYWSNNLAFTIASVLGGFAADASYLLIFVVDAVTTAVAAVLIFSLVGETRPAEADPRRSSGEGAKPPRGDPYRDLAWLSFCGMVFLTTLIFLQYQTALSLAMVRDGLAPRTYGIVIAINAVLIVLGQLFVPKLLKRWDTVRSLALSAVIVGVGFGLTTFAHVAWFYGLTVVVWTIGEMINSPSYAALMGQLSPVTARGRYQGMFSVVMSMASFAAPLIGGFVFGHFGRALWVGCFLLGIVVALLTLMLRPFWARRDSELSSAKPVAASL